MSNKKCVAIVGAGASGITAAKQALDYDIKPIVFERSANFGGLWRYKSTDTEEPSVMKSTIINTSKEMTAFSDFPPPPESANYMHNRNLLEYFEQYIEHFNINQYIRYNHNVLSIERSNNYNQTGKWILTYKTKNDLINVEEFDGVLLCSGHHTIPFMPIWPNQDSYNGNIIHAHSYKDHRNYEDKVVAVVGVGNSGVDVAVELSRIAKQVYLISRRGTWVAYRNSDYGMPLDLIVNCRYFATFFNNLPFFLTEALFTREIEKRFNHEKFNLKPKHSIFSAHITLNDDLLNRLASGTIKIKNDLQSFTKNGLLLTDNTTIEVDNVVCCTGYSFEFSIVENGNLIPVTNNEVNNLYKYVFPVDTSDHNTLGVIGLIQPIGSIMPISEMQARVFFNVFTGKTKLCNKDAMKKDIEKKKKNLEKRYIHSRRHTIQVDYIQYMDELGNMIGCVPSILRYLITDPLLAYRLFFGPNAAYVYRLQGPKSWSGAHNAIMQINNRVECGMKGVKCLTNKKNYSKLYLLAITFTFASAAGVCLALAPALFSIV